MYQPIEESNIECFCRSCLDFGDTNHVLIAVLVEQLVCWVELHQGKKLHLVV